MNGQKEQAKSLFLNALEIASHQERKAYLDTHCGTDEDLRREVEELLRHQAQAGVFLESPPLGIATVDEPIREGPGTVIGPYKLLQEIGEGGMGVVFMAEQEQSVKRRVALKVIKPGMDSRQVIGRFEAERQALAMMDHVNIARVLDAGTIPYRRPLAPREESPLAEREVYDGRPYFVMELVHGVPITKYCDDNHLTPRESRRAGIRAGLPGDPARAPEGHHPPRRQAVQRHDHAVRSRRAGSAQGDRLRRGQGDPGAPGLTERTLFTQYGTLVGTLEYMSPEQAEMSPGAPGSIPAATSTRWACSCTSC